LKNLRGLESLKGLKGLKGLESLKVRVGKYKAVLFMVVIYETMFFKCLKYEISLNFKLNSLVALFYEQYK